jgi:hypothetical protein
MEGEAFSESQNRSAPIRPRPIPKPAPGVTLIR